MGLPTARTTTTTATTKTFMEKQDGNTEDKHTQARRQPENSCCMKTTIYLDALKFPFMYLVDALQPVVDELSLLVECARLPKEADLEEHTHKIRTKMTRNE